MSFSERFNRFLEPENIRKFLKKCLYLAVLWGLAFLFYFLKLRGLLIGYLLLACLAMVLAILLQSCKGGGLAAIGGMSGDAILGTRASTPVAKATFALGILFIMGAMLLARLPAPAPTTKETIFEEKEVPQPAEGAALTAPKEGERPAEAPPAAGAAPPAPGPAAPPTPTPAPENEGATDD